MAALERRGRNGNEQDRWLARALGREQLATKHWSLAVHDHSSPSAGIRPSQPEVVVEASQRRHLDVLCSRAHFAGVVASSVTPCQ